MKLDWPEPYRNWPLPNGGVSYDQQYRGGKFLQGWHVRLVIASANRRDAKWAKVENFMFWMQAIFGFRENSTPIRKLIERWRSA